MRLLFITFGREDPAQGEEKREEGAANQQRDDARACAWSIHQPVKKLKEGLFQRKVHRLISCSKFAGAALFHFPNGDGGEEFVEEDEDQGQDTQR